MSLYTDIVAGITVWTNRPDLTAEMDIAIKQALRTAHKSGTFYRDLVVVNLTGQTVQQVQTIDLSANCPNYRQICYVKPASLDIVYDPVDIRDLFDYDRVYKTNVYYGMGTSLILRAANPVDAIDICYHKMPTVNPIANIDSWIADLHQELIVLWAAATILAFIGEQEVKTRVEALAKIAYQDLIEDATELVRR